MYDDARFESYTMWPVAERPTEYHEWKLDKEFVAKCKENLAWVGGDMAGLVRARTGADPKPDEELIDLKHNIALYRQIYLEQQDILDSGLHCIALVESLEAFPTLEKVNLTSEAHQLAIHAPRYPTPLISSFPPSFNYPAPSPWSGRFDNFNS